MNPWIKSIIHILVVVLAVAVIITGIVLYVKYCDNEEDGIDPDEVTELLENTSFDSENIFDSEAILDFELQIEDQNELVGFRILYPDNWIYNGDCENYTVNHDEGKCDHIKVEFVHEYFETIWHDFDSIDWDEAVVIGTVEINNEYNNSYIETEISNKNWYLDEEKPEEGKKERFKSGLYQVYKYSFLNEDDEDHIMKVYVMEKNWSDQDEESNQNSEEKLYYTFYYYIFTPVDYYDDLEESELVGGMLDSLELYNPKS